jgi:hypothetical protein
MNTESALREMLADAADAAPTSISLLGAVRARARRRRRSRIMVTAAVTAIVVASLVVGVPRVADRVSKNATGQTMSWLTFPYTPDWAPGTYTTGFNPSPSSLHDVLSELTFRPTDSTQPTVHVSIGAYPPDHYKSGVVHATVDGLPATVVTRWYATSDATSPAGSVIFWSPKPGQWVEVDTRVVTSAANLIGYVDHLRAKPLPAAGFVAMPRLPAGVTVSTQTENQLILHINGEALGELSIYPVPSTTLLPWKVGLTTDAKDESRIYVYRIGNGYYVIMQALKVKNFRTFDFSRFVKLVHVSYVGTPVPTS